MAKAKFDRKTQIVANASDLFSTLGYDKVTIKSLALSCGITEPALYRHFESKEAIYCAVLDTIEGRLEYVEVFKRLETKKDVEELLHGLATHIIEFFIKNEDIYRLLLYSALRGHSRARRIYRIIRGTYVRFLMKQFDRLYKEGNILKKNNEITARCFVGMVFDCAMGTTLWKGFQGKVFKPVDVVTNNVPIYARGLRESEK